MDVSELKLKFATQGVDGTISDMRRVDGGIKQIEATGNSAGSSIKSLFGLASGFVVGAGIFQGAQGLLTMSSNAEQAKVSLETVVGSAAKVDVVFRGIQDFAAATPFSFPELVQSSINLEAFGMKTMEWLPTIGDTAAAMGKSVDQVTQAILDASTGEYERLKELGIKTRIEGDAVSFQFMRNGEQITETVDRNNQEMINSTIQAIWNEKYSGAMQRQAATLGGQWSTLKDTVSIRAMEMSDGIYDSLRGTVSFANDVFAVGWQDAIDNAFGDGSPIGSALSNVGTLADGIVDAFGEGSSVDSIVAKMPESWQGAADAVLTVSDSLGDLKSAYDTNGISGLFDQLQEEVTQIAEAGLDLGVMAVTGAVELGGDLAGDLSGYVWRRIKAAVYGTTADATGGPMAPELRRDIPVGTVLVSIAEIAVKSVAGWAASATPSVQTWLDTNELSGFTQAIRVDAFDPAFDSIAVGDYAQAVQDALTADPIEVTPEVEINIELGFENWARGAKERVGEMDWSDVGEIFKIGIIGGLAVVNLPLVVSTWFTVTAGPDILRAGRRALNGVLNGFFLGEEMTSGVGAGSHTERGTSVLDSWWEGIKEALTPDFSGINAPGMPTWMTDYSDWLTAPVNKLVAGIDGAVTLVREAWDKLLFWQSSEGKAFATNTGSNTVGGGMGLNLIPRTWLNESQNGPQAPSAGGANPNWLPEAQPFVAKLGIDRTEFDAGLDDATGDLSHWGTLVEKATFGADNGPAAVAYSDAFKWGTIWGDTTFSASFSIDTSPLYSALSVVRGIAQEISDLLPNSPAKKGPLARPVSFGYIADSLRGTLDDMAGMTPGGLNRVALGIAPGRFAAAAAPMSSRDPQVVVNINGGFFGKGAREEIMALAAEQAERVVKRSNLAGAR